MFSPTKEAQNSISPKKAIEILKQGNERFINNNLLKRDLLQHVKASSNGQYPLAVVLSCIDSRVPTEIIFDQGISNIFNARVAGNIINEDILGSMEYACKVAGSKAIVVLGHTKCGAIISACKRVKLGNITELLSKIDPSVNKVIGQGNTTDNEEKIHQITVENIKLAMEDIVKKSSILKELAESGEIKIVGAIYDVHTGKVDFLDE